MNSHKETLTKQKLEMLKRAYSLMLANGKNEIKLNDFSDNINTYNNFQKMKYHSLIYKIKRGTWGITSHGLDFLKGERALPPHVWVQDNEVIAHSDETVSIYDLNEGEVVIQQVFEYADGSERPGNRQVALL